VPDLLEEMVQRTLDDNGRVSVIRDAPFSVAAKLRFPVTKMNHREATLPGAAPARTSRQAVQGPDPGNRIPGCGEQSDPSDL
jgi:hypothetical protein